MKQISRIRKGGRLFAIIAALSVTALTAANPAFAAGEGGEQANLFAGDLGNMIWTLVVFGLVVFVLGKFAWKPILKGLQAREDFISNSLAEAKADRDQAEESLKKIEARLADARTEASAIVEEGRRDADVVRAKIEEDARDEAEKMVARAKREIELATQTAVKEIYAKADKLAVEAASAVIKREINPADHTRLIQDAIAAIEAKSDA